MFACEKKRKGRDGRLTVETRNAASIEKWETKVNLPVLLELRQSRQTRYFVVTVFYLAVDEKAFAGLPRFFYC